MNWLVTWPPADCHPVGFGSRVCSGEPFGLEEPAIPTTPSAMTSKLPVVIGAPLSASIITSFRYRAWTGDGNVKVVKVWALTWLAENTLANAVASVVVAETHTSRSLTLDENRTPSRV